MADELNIYFVEDGKNPQYWKILVARNEETAKALSGYLNVGQCFELAMPEDAAAGEVIAECKPKCPTCGREH